jgi:hypothetical protein
MNKARKIIHLQMTTKSKDVIDLNELIFTQLGMMILKPMTINHLSSRINLFYLYKTHF